MVTTELLGQVKMVRGDTAKLGFTVKIGTRAADLTNATIELIVQGCSPRWSAYRFVKSTADGSIVVTSPSTGGKGVATVSPADTLAFGNERVEAEWSVVVTDAFGEVSTTKGGDGSFVVERSP